MNARFSLSLFLPIVLLGCLEGSTGPVRGGPPEIHLRVTGGVAGVDYSILVDGPMGQVVGEECISGCAFEAGDILQGITADQVGYLAELFQEAGIVELAGTDFGNECCDQFHYEVTYSDDSVLSEVAGSSEALPPTLLEAIEAVDGFARDRFPVVVAMDANPGAWPRDSFQFRDIRIQGDLLRVDVTYGGGCAIHHFSLVAHGGWMESNPVQVQAFLAHDGHDDPCDALIHRDLRFDLSPLKRVYQDAYGTGTPGSTTLVINVAGGGIYSSSQPFPVAYVF